MKEKIDIPGWVPGCIGLVMAFIALGMGTFIMLSAFNIIPSAKINPENPPIIVAAAGLVFFLAGLITLMGSIFSPEELRLPVMMWLQFLLILAVMAVFSSVFLWTGFGPGERTFQASTSVGPISTYGQGNATVGRILFGGFGLLSGLATAWYAYAQVKNLVNGQFKSMFDRKNQTLETK
jgi:hypothetical protein